MKIHRFIDDFSLTGKEEEIKGEIAHQIIKVLKIKVGEKIELCNRQGISAMAEIVKIENKSLIAKIENVFKQEKAGKKVSLFCAILKKENFETVVQKATECGVNKIIPIISERTIKTGLNLERLERIAKEASEQSGRFDVPEIAQTVSFEKSLELVDKNSLNVIFDKSGESAFSKADSPLINIWIGPEGGWTEKEIELAKNNNFKIISLGKLVLRAETAAIISTFWASNL